jgi:hypothetical protein
MYIDLFLFYLFIFYLFIYLFIYLFLYEIKYFFVVPYRVRRVQYCVYDFVALQWNGSTLAMYKPDNING